MSGELGVGLIGAGHMGANHAHTWERVRRARLLAIADPNEVAAAELIRRSPIEWHRDYRTMLDRDDIDAVCICAPSERHAQIALDAIAAGKHVFVEKPIATTLEDGLRMSSAASFAHRKLVVGHIERFNPAVRKLVEIVEDGRLGQIFRVHATRVGPLPARIRDTGVALDLATHDLDVMQHVLKRDITSIYADGSRVLHPTQEDMIACLLRFGESGPAGLLDVNWVTPEKRREITLIGEGGMATASYLTQDVWFTEAVEAPIEWKELAQIRGGTAGAVIRFPLQRVEPLKAELDAFTDCVLDDLPEPVSAADGCRALAAALAVRDSAAHSRRVTLLEVRRAEPLVAVAA
jgi:UDP-N-acetylglucosamine 3-dehydrogenase